MSSSPIPVHLLVLIHGMWGHPSHLNELVRRMQKKHPITEGNVKLWVMNAKTNSEELTYDGIDWGGERVVDEIEDEVQTIKKQGGRVVRLSVTGYSLGGLIARYVVGILHHRGFFKDVKPINFNTIATPHIGLPRYTSMLSAIMAACAKYLSRTGDQFYCRDKWSTTDRSLLEVMADPDQMFYKALSAFQCIRIYANAVNDVTVPYVTGAIELEDPFADRAGSGVQIDINTNYEPIVERYSLPPTAVNPAVLSASWFRQMKPSSKRLLLPVQNLKLPLHKKIFLYSLMPLLLGVGVTLALRRFKADEKMSRSRLIELESDVSRSRRLVHTFSQLEQQAEDIVIKVLEGVRVSGYQEAVSSEPEGSHTPWATGSSNKREAVATGPRLEQPIPAGPEYHLRRTIDQPKLTAKQKKMVEQLNQLPLVKHLVLFDGVRNAHALIVCRDAEYFPEMHAGRGVVKHWVDSFVV